MRFFPSFNTFIEIGPLSIQWYAVCILTGAAIAYFLGQYHFKKLGYSKEILSDYVFGLLFVGIIGARIWYVIFMWNELYANNPMEIIMINHGGLAIQGGVITGLIYSYFFFKKRNISFLVAGMPSCQVSLLPKHVGDGAISLIKKLMEVQLIQLS